MARHFPDFLKAYFEYAKDGFVPDRFHSWTGLSILAAAIERKITLKQGRIYHIPNLYVMLISHPGMGKSTAIDVGIDLLERLRLEHNPHFRIIPEKTTEPSLIEQMSIVERIPLPSNPNVLLPQSAGFFYAREASDSALNNKNTVGDFIAALTAFYDCPKFYRKKTNMMKEMVVIENVCFNLLSGATFNYLRTLVNESSVMGGFASRLLYIACHDRIVREIKWGQGNELDREMGNRLVEDLAHINKLVGPMKPSPGFIARYEKWQPEFDRYLIELQSERMESIMARKGTNLLKVAMLLSVSESDSLILEEKHFVEAQELIEDATKDNRSIIVSAIVQDKTGQEGINLTITEYFRRNEGIVNPKQLRAMLFKGGNPVDKVDGTLTWMITSGLIKIEQGTGNYVYQEPQGIGL